MSKLFLMLFMIPISLMTDAKLYDDKQINRLINKDTIVEGNKQFNRGFFVSKNPKLYVENYIGINKNRIEPLFIESRLLSLLNEISYQPKQPYLQVFVTQMKQYQTQAFKLHDEGRVPVPIYNIKARAKGIDNIWLASEALNDYTHLFNQDAISTLDQLKSTLNSMKNPEWLGLKNSIKSISSDNHVVITDYFLSSPKNLNGLGKFISHYALFTGNKQLVQLALKHLDQSNSEYLLRKLSEYFDEEFVVNQLINTVEGGKNKAFAISMMSPYLVHKRVQDTLLKSIENKELSSQAALVLTQAKNENILQKLESTYNNKNVSQDVQKQIIFVMKMNKLKESDAILTRLLDTGVNDEKSTQWLNSFKGEVK